MCDLSVAMKSPVFEHGSIVRFRRFEEFAFLQLKEMTIFRMAEPFDELVEGHGISPFAFG